MEIIYIDSLFFLNLLTDYLLCLASARLCGLYLKRRRYLLAGLLGAAYAVAAILPELSFLAGPLCKLAVGLLMGWIAFGAEAQPLRCILVLLMVAAAFGGLLYALSLTGNGPARLSLRTLLIAFFLCYGLLRLLSRFRSRRKEQPHAQIALCFLGHEVHFTALHDSGNALSDPASGAGVMVVSPHALKPIFREYADLFAQLSPVELLSVTAEIPALSGQFRLIPYRSLSGGGLLAAFRPDRLTIDGAETKELLVAVSPNAHGDGFDAIL